MSILTIRDQKPRFCLVRTPTKTPFRSTGSSFRTLRDLLRRALVAEELLLALRVRRVLECESARPAEGGVQGGGEEARHGEVVRSFRVAGRFAARSDWQADLGDSERQVDRDVRTIASEDQGGAGADDEAGRPIGEQGGRQARRHKATANLPSMTRRYRATAWVLDDLGFDWRKRRLRPRPVRRRHRGQRARARHQS